MDELENNNAFADVMAKGKLEMPFSDFEDNVMQLIEEKTARKSTITRELKLSRFFFIVGSIFGFVISILLSQVKEPFLGVDQNIIALTFQIGFATLFFTQVESYLKIKNNN
jgi:TRAP-type C4-dicarboxylate transport system permease small subunit